MKESRFIHNDTPAVVAVNGDGGRGGDGDRRVEKRYSPPSAAVLVVTVSSVIAESFGYDQGQW